MVDSNHSLWLSTSHFTTLRLHIILTKTSTRTDKSSSSQERLISLSPNLIFRRTPFYFVTSGPFCNLIGLQYTLPKEQLSIRPDPLCASMRVWLRETKITRCGKILNCAGWLLYANTVTIKGTEVQTLGALYTWARLNRQTDRLL